MITVKVIRDKSGICGIESRGHADFAEYGSDIVCAGVSALMINAANSLEQFTEDELKIEEGGADGGYLMFRLGSERSAEAELLMKSLILGLRSIEETYGNQYLTLKDEN